MVSFEKAVSEQLCKIQDELRKIRILNEVQEARDVGVVYIAIPESGDTRSFSTGTTVIDFYSGKIKNPDGSVDGLQINLQRLGKDFLHSLSMTSDLDVVIQIGTQNKRTVEANLGLELPYLTYKEISITTTATTKISIYASTNPFSTVNGNTVSIMKGQNAGRLVTVAVNASGNIIGVLKGDYGGTLKTISVDTNGLIQAKIFDPDDVFGQSYAVGLGEHAARLGGMMSFDRRGQFAWADNFDSPVLKWVTSLGGGTSSVILDTAVARSGERSCKLTTGSSSGQQAEINHYEYPRLNTKHGLEAAIRFGTLATGDYIEMSLLQFASFATYLYNIKWYPADGTLYYLNSGGVYTQFATVGLGDITNGTWYVMKMVSDLAANKYIRFLLNDIQYDLNVAGQALVSAEQARRTKIVLRLVNASNNARQCWIDNVIWTINEP